MSDGKRISEACLALYAPGLHLDNYTARAFRFLRQLASAEFIACGTQYLSTGKLDIGFDTDHSNFPAAMEALGRLMAKYPLFNWDPTINDGRPFCRSQFFSSRQFKNLDLYREVYRPLGIDNHCAIFVPTRPGEVMFFGIERKGGPDFSADTLALLEVAQAHLANAHRLARLFDDAIEGNVTIDSLTRAGLTPREAETLFWMNQGKSNGEIALLLQVCVYTVKDHVASIFNKTGAGNRLAAVLWARRTCCRLSGPPSENLSFPTVTLQPNLQR